MHVDSISLYRQVRAVYESRTGNKPHVPSGDSRLLCTGYYVSTGTKSGVFVILQRYYGAGSFVFVIAEHDGAVPPPVAGARRRSTVRYMVITRPGAWSTHRYCKIVCYMHTCMTMSIRMPCTEVNQKPAGTVVLFARVSSHTAAKLSIRLVCLVVYALLVYTSVRMDIAEQAVDLSSDGFFHIISMKRKLAT